MLAAGGGAYTGELMGAEGFIFQAGALLAGALLGFAVALAIKVIGRREKLPGWPILLFVPLAAILPVVFYPNL